MNFLTKTLITVGLAISSFFGAHQSPMVGAVVPVTSAFYSDSLQSGINPTATSFTLVKGKDSAGNSLSGTYGFVIDQGSPSQEIVYCTTVSGTSVTGCSRGIDLTTGTSTVLALEQTHNRGATVQITTAPVVNILANIMRGVESINQPIFYQSGVSSSTLATNGKNLASVDLVNYVGTTGCANASEGVRGCVDLATGLQAASSTSVGSTGSRLAIPSSLATSTPGNSTGKGNIVSVQDNGKIHQNFLDLTQAFTFSGANIFTSSTNTFNSLARFNVAPEFGTFNATSSLVTSTSTISGNLNILLNASTTNLKVTGTCVGCVSGYERIQNNTALSTGQNQISTSTATCSTGKKVIGGGWSGPISPSGFFSSGATGGKYEFNGAYPDTQTSFAVIVTCVSSGGCSAGTLSAYAICVNI